jgi:hypothetical protein
VLLAADALLTELNSIGDKITNAGTSIRVMLARAGLPHEPKKEIVARPPKGARSEDDDDDEDDEDSEEERNPEPPRKKKKGSVRLFLAHARPNTETVHTGARHPRAREDAARCGGEAALREQGSLVVRLHQLRYLLFLSNLYIILITAQSCSILTSAATAARSRCTARASTSRPGRRRGGGSTASKTTRTERNCGSEKCTNTCLPTCTNTVMHVCSLVDATPGKRPHLALT